MSRGRYIDGAAMQVGRRRCTRISLIVGAARWRLLARHRGGGSVTCITASLIREVRRETNVNETFCVRALCAWGEVNADLS